MKEGKGREACFGERKRILESQVTTRKIALEKIGGV
jgi:hypothetical protein